MTPKILKGIAPRQTVWIAPRPQTKSPRVVVRPGVAT